MASIEEVWSRSYTTVLRRAYEEEETGLFDPYIREEDHIGEGAQALLEIKRSRFRRATSRIAKTQLEDPQFGQYWVFPYRRTLALGSDAFDKVRMNDINPSSSFSLSILDAYGSMRDADVIAAAQGNARKGEQGSEIEPFDDSKNIGSASNAKTMNEDLVAECLAQALNLKMATKTGQLLFVMSPHAYARYSVIESVKNTLINQGQPTAPMAKPGMLLRFTPIVYPVEGDDLEGDEMLNSGANYHECLVISARHMVRAMFMRLTMKFSERDDLNAASQWLGLESSAVTRLRKNCVFKVYVSSTG